MSDKPAAPPPAELPIAKNGEVKAYDRLGNKITVPKEKIGELYSIGGRVAQVAEVAQAQQRAEYDAKSTGQKLGGAVAGLAAGPVLGNALAGTGAITEAPEVQAFNQGQNSALTGGLDQVAVKKALELTAGKEAASAYGKHQLEVAQANQDWKTAGEVTGFAATALSGGAGGAARALPGVGFSAAGGVAENLAARAAAGVASKGVLGRALATGAELGARGAVEGALYGASQQVTEDVLGDKELAADKVFAAAGHGALMGGLGGAALGAGGSLAKSAVMGTAGAIKGGLARALSRGEEAVAGVASKADDVATAEGGKLGAAAKGEAAAAQEGGRLGALGEAMRSPNDAARKLSNELAVDALGATKGQAARALEHVHGGADAVGEYVNRIAIKPSTEGGGIIGSAFKAGAAGRADEILPAIQADIASRIKGGFDQALGGTNAKINYGDLGEMVTTHAQQMRANPVQAAGADAFEQRIGTELASLHAAGKVAADGSIDATDLFFTNAALRKNAYELSRTNGAAGEAYKGFLREMDKKIVSKIDEAAAAAGEVGRGDKIRHWKREYQLAKAAEEMAEGGAERVTRNNIFGLREGIGAAVGMAMGSPLAGIATAVGGKVLRERGAAAGAALLSKIADMGTLSKLVRGIDDQIAHASQGLLAAPKKGALPELPTGTARVRAEAAAERVAQAKADPEAFIDQVTRQTEAIAVTAPELAGGLSKRMTDGISFLASKMPQSPPPDPLDPHPRTRMTDAQASEFARYAWYVEKPSRFFVEVSHGKLTFEGIETAKALMPGAFAEMQARTAEGLATLAAQGRQPPYQQRANLGMLLGFPATPDQRPEHRAFLQANAMLTSSQPTSGPAPAKRASSNISQRSPLDRLEAGGPGRK
jgi:hypothetical protein